jgi:hypothetical protein
LKKEIAVAALGFGTLVTMLPQRTFAQANDDWRFNAVVYGYFPTIGGTSAFPASGGPSIDVDADKIINALKFAFMGEVEAHKGRWGILTDVLYMDLGGSKSQTRDLTIGHVTLPAGITANANLDVKGTVWELAGMYRMVSDPASTLDLVAGARVINYKQTLDWEFSADLGPSEPSRTGSSQLKLTNWDGIVGLKGRLAFGENREWIVPYYVDVGTGESELTWQVFGGVGYAFKWGDVLAGWRYLDYRFKSGTRLEDTNFNGPMVGVAFHW